MSRRAQLIELLTDAEWNALESAVWLMSTDGDHPRLAAHACSIAAKLEMSRVLGYLSQKVESVDVVTLLRRARGGPAPKTKPRRRK